MRTAAVLAALLSTALPAAVLAEAKGPVVLVLPGPEAAKPYVFQLKGEAGEVLCTSDGFKSSKQAQKAAKKALGTGKDLKNYIFLKSSDAKGEHHLWELREGKAHAVLVCRSGPVAGQGQAEHSAGAATKAFAKATVAVK